jgi:hypothetical protein
LTIYSFFTNSRQTKDRNKKINSKTEINKQKRNESRRKQTFLNKRDLDFVSMGFSLGTYKKHTPPPNHA